ncbi:alpha/beta-hydrolase [Ganoderma leucocontextum]|nr:alpha/beta-hydrolase [Ganoderma leucocontextum]
MDPTKFKDVQVKRGYTYHYYYSPASAGKPTLFFIHGFPSTSSDWSRQVAHLQPKGYGIIVPDCLGYGGSSKPTDYKEFRHKLISQDLVDIINTEGLQSVIGIGHDWGSALLSNLAVWHPDRFIAFAWIALSFTPANPVSMNFDKLLPILKEKMGSETYGYWAFFVTPEAPDIVAKNIDSFLDLTYPKDPETWKHWLGPLGKIEEWVSTNRRAERPDWFSEQEYAAAREGFLRNGLQSPMNYYKTMVFDANIEDNKALPEGRNHIKKPALFVAATRDQVCRADVGKGSMAQWVPHAEIVELESGHWVQLEASEQLNQTLESWIGRISPQ